MILQVTSSCFSNVKQWGASTQSQGIQSYVSCKRCNNLWYSSKWSWSRFAKGKVCSLVWQVHAFPRKRRTGAHIVQSTASQCYISSKYRVIKLSLRNDFELFLHPTEGLLYDLPCRHHCSIECHIRGCRGGGRGGGTEIPSPKSGI